jgi:hypothetical protein
VEKEKANMDELGLGLLSHQWAVMCKWPQPFFALRLYIPFFFYYPSRPKQLSKAIGISIIEEYYQRLSNLQSQHLFLEF